MADNVEQNPFIDSIQLQQQLSDNPFSGPNVIRSIFQMSVLRKMSVTVISVIVVIITPFIPHFFNIILN